MTWYDVLLRGVLPYVVIAILVSGTIWRYRYTVSYTHLTLPTN